MLALLDEMDREHPITPEGRAAGEKLWQAMQTVESGRCPDTPPSRG